MDKHRNGKTDPQGSQNFVQAQTARVGQNVSPAQSGNGFLANRRIITRLFLLVFTLCCIGFICFISWVMLVVRDPFVTFLLYVPVFVILLPMVIVSCIRLKSWGARAYCLIFFVIVMLWSTGLTAIIRTSPMTRLKIISGGYDSCKNSGVAWGNNNRIAICGDIDDTWFEYSVVTVAAYDSSGEIAKKIDRRSSAWNSGFIELSRLYALSHFTEKEAESGMRPGWGAFVGNDRAVRADLRIVHVYGNFYLINFPVSPADRAAIL